MCVLDAEIKIAVCASALGRHIPLICVIAPARDTSRLFSFLPPVFPCLTLFLNSFPPPRSLLSVPPVSLATACPSLPLSASLRRPPTHPAHPPPPPFLPFPLGSGAKVGWRTEANTAQGRAEGNPKAGELIMCMFMFERVLPVCLFVRRVPFFVTRNCK